MSLIMSFFFLLPYSLDRRENLLLKSYILFLILIPLVIVAVILGDFAYFYVAVKSKPASESSLNNEDFLFKLIFFPASLFGYVVYVQGILGLEVGWMT